MRITPSKRYTFANATEYGFAPDERCDICLGVFYQRPITDQSRSGAYHVYCSEKCAAVGGQRFYGKKLRLGGTSDALP